MGRAKGLKALRLGGHGGWGVPVPQAKPNQTEMVPQERVGLGGHAGV